MTKDSSVITFLCDLLLLLSNEVFNHMTEVNVNVNKSKTVINESQNKKKVFMMVLAHKILMCAQKMILQSLHLN